MRLVTALLLGLVGHQVKGRIWGGSGSQKIVENSPSSDISISISRELGGRSLGFVGESVMASDWFSMDPFHGAGWGSGWPKVEDQPKIGKVVTETLPAKETGKGGKSKEEMSKEFEIVPKLTEASQLGSLENGGNSENWKTLKTGTFSSKVKSGGKLTNLKLHKDSYQRPENSKPELEKIREVKKSLRKACQKTNSRDVLELCKEMQIEVGGDKIPQQPTRKFHPSELLTIDWRQVLKDAMKKRNEKRLLDVKRRVAAERETEKHLFFHPHSFKRRKAAIGMVDSIKSVFFKLMSPLSGRAARKHLISPSGEENQSLKKSFRINPTSSRKRFHQPERSATVSGAKK